MSRKEDIETIRGILSGRLLEKAACREQEFLGIQARDAERERRVALVQQQIRNTGVVDLIEGVCKEGLIGLNDGSRTIPEVILDTGMPRVFVNFDYGLDSQGDSRHSHVEARIEGGVFVVEGREAYWVEGKMTMVTALGLALADPRIDGRGSVRRSWGV